MKSKEWWALAPPSAPGSNVSKNLHKNMVKEDKKKRPIKFYVILKKIDQSKSEKIDAKEANARLWVYFPWLGLKPM